MTEPHIYNSIAITAITAPINPVPAMKLLAAAFPDCVATALDEDLVAPPVPAGPLVTVAVPLVLV